MTRVATLILLLLSWTAKADDVMVHVQEAAITQPDGSTILAGEGCYLDKPSCISVAQRLVKAERERKELREEVLKPEPTDATLQSGGPLIAVAIAALALGLVLGRASK
jgi:hypothetical protein